MHSIEDFRLALLCAMLLFTSKTATQRSSTALAVVPPPTPTTAPEHPPAPSTSSPVCMQPRTAADPSPAALQSYISEDDSINRACNPVTQQTDWAPTIHTFYSLGGYYYFNTTLIDSVSSLSTRISTPTSFPGNHSCASNLNAIFSSCVSDQGFLGGWLVVNGLNCSSESSGKLVSNHSG